MILKMIDGLPALQGAGNYPFDLLVDGADLVARDVLATWFGGDDDPNDNGETASGVMTRGNPGVLGCALPLDFGPCAGSPVPNIPFRDSEGRLQIWVRIFNRANKEVLTVPAIDRGPSPPPLAEGIIDCTQETSRRLNNGVRDNMRVDFRIHGGAHWLGEGAKAALRLAGFPVPEFSSPLHPGMPGVE